MRRSSPAPCGDHLLSSEARQRPVQSLCISRIRRSCGQSSAARCGSEWTEQKPLAVDPGITGFSRSRSCLASGSISPHPPKRRARTPRCVVAHGCHLTSHIRISSDHYGRRSARDRPSPGVERFATVRSSFWCLESNFRNQLLVLRLLSALFNVLKWVRIPLSPPLP
jgi:hypothetical protein